MVQRTSAGEIRRTGRATQGVTVMNVKDGDRISAVALVVESDSDDVGDADEAEGPDDAQQEISEEVPAEE